jgi:hypothetical protein
MTDKPPSVVPRNPPVPPEPPRPPDPPSVSPAPASDCGCHSDILKEVNQFLLNKLHQAVCAPPCGPSQAATPEARLVPAGSQLWEGSAGITLSTDNGNNFGGSVGVVDAWTAGLTPGITVETFEITNPTAFGAVGPNGIIQLAKTGPAPSMATRLATLIGNTSNSTSKRWAHLSGITTTVNVTATTPTDIAINGSVAGPPSTPSTPSYFEIYVGTNWGDASSRPARGRLYRHEMTGSDPETTFYEHTFFDQYYFYPSYESDINSQNNKIFMKRVTSLTSLSSFVRASHGNWTRHTFSYFWLGLT